MSGLQRIVRHPDRRNDPHARAHALASEALLAPLPEDDALWLDEHLAGCEPCRAAADAFAADAAILRAARAEQPAVPRDLGARVSLALDDEVRRATRGRRPAAARGRVRGPRLAYAGLIAVAVVALVVAPLALPPGTPGTSAPPPGSSVPVVAVPTPISVDSQPVAYVRRAADGTYVLSSADVEAVCPGTDASACGTLDASARTLGSLAVEPSSVVLPRDGGPAVVVGNDTVYVVPFAAASPSPASTVEPSTGPSPEPVQSPAATGVPASPPADSPAPSGEPASPAPTTEPPSPPPSGEPASPPPSGEPSSPAPTAEPASPPPSGETPPPASPDASAIPGPASPVPTATPAPATPQPTMPPATPAPPTTPAIKIAEKVALVGTPPSYSADGRWVAFSARPANGEHGPDVYVWRVGAERARQLTDDHNSVFSGWYDDQIVASTARLAAADGQPPADVAPASDADPAAVTARSYLLDPATRATTAIDRDGVWRPVVDPTHRIVVYWSGDFAWSERQQSWVPTSGRLVTVGWTELRDPADASPATPLPRKAAGAIGGDFDVRFDPAGRRLAVWVADPAEPGSGRLALVAVEAGGRLGDVEFDDAAALPGYSLDADRLAWSTPPGRNGKGSLVTVYAWRGDNAGQIYSVPDAGDEPVLVAH